MKTRSTVTVKDTKGRHDRRRAGCTRMDGANLLEDCKRQEGLPYGGRPPQTKLGDDYHPSMENHILGVSDQVSSAAGDPQEGATRKETCSNADTALTMDKMNENTVEKKYDEEQQGTTNPPCPARGDLPKSNISGILQHHLSREEFLKGEGIDCETLPEISNPDSSHEAIVKSIILRYVSSWPEEQAPELTSQLNPERDDEGSAKPSRLPSAAEESTSELEEPAAAGDSSHPESSNFLTEAKSPSHKQKGRQGQAPQNHQTEKTGSGHGFQCDQVHYRFSDFSNIAPPGNSPENNVIDKPPPTDKQDPFSHELRDRLALVQDILESLSRSNCVEKEEQERKTPDPSLETETEPTRRIYRERFTGTESETSLSKLTSASQKNPPASSSYIFQKLSHGKRMCQKLREQTDRLRSKVQEFSRSIAQDSPCHMRDKRLALEKLQGRLARLEQEFMANKEKHLTWKQQVRKHEPPAVGDFDPERKVEGEMFRLEMLLEEVKEKIDEGRHPPASSPPARPPATPADLPPPLPAPSPPPSDECRPYRDQGCRLDALSHDGEREKSRPSVKSDLTGNALLGSDKTYTWLMNWTLGPDTELSCCWASGTGPRSNECETCGSKIPNPPRGCRKEALREFHYKYNMPGQNYSNHEEESAFVQLRFLNENKNSSPACSKPNWIYSECTNSKPSQDEHEPTPGKNNSTAFTAHSSDLASFSPHFHSCRTSGSKSSGNLSSIEETQSEGLNSSLDNALRTAIVLKETTDRMIRTIAEDLAKVQRWRNRLKY